MKVVAFYIFLFFLLLGGGHNFYADTFHGSNYPSSKSFAKDKSVKFSNKDQFTTIIEDTDIDLEEDHLGGEDVKKSTADKNFIEKSKFQSDFYLALPNQFILHHYSKKTKTSQSNCRHSIPIYITNRVLRI